MVVEVEKRVEGLMVPFHEDCLERARWAVMRMMARRAAVRGRVRPMLIFL